MKLLLVWKCRLNLRAEGDKLREEGEKLRVEGNKHRAERYRLQAKGCKLYAEGDKLYAEGDKLRAEGNRLWAEAVLKAYGNIWMDWNGEDQSYECHLENGEVYGFGSSEG